MAGAGLIDIKRRIKSISNTKKITSAMNVVATSKLRKCRNKLEFNDVYFNYLQEVMSVVAQNGTESNIYTKGNESDKTLYLTITSDSGLCGSFNSEVVAHTASLMKGKKDKSFVTIVGQKGRSYLKRYNIKTDAEFVDMADMPQLSEATTLMHHIMDKYLNKEVGEVYIVYYEFISTMKRVIKAKKLLPLDSSDSKKDGNSSSYFEFEPSAQEILRQRMQGYITGSILNCMISSRCSEEASRLESMSNATKNANDLLEKLTVKYNRIRQSAITQEISEIVGGAEAQK